MSYYDDWDGTVANPTVYVENGAASWVLDSNGNPYVVTKRYKMGFDLTPKAQKAETTLPQTQSIRPFMLVF